MAAANFAIKQALADLGKNKRYDKYVAKRLNTEDDAATTPNYEQEEDEDDDAWALRVLKAGKTQVVQTVDPIFRSFDKKVNEEKLEALGERLVEGHWYFVIEGNVSKELMEAYVEQFGAPVKPSFVKKSIERRIEMACKAEEQAMLRPMLQDALVDSMKALRIYGSGRGRGGNIVQRNGRRVATGRGGNGPRGTNGRGNFGNWRN